MRMSLPLTIPSHTRFLVLCSLLPRKPHTPHASRPESHGGRVPCGRGPGLTLLLIFFVYYYFLLSLLRNAIISLTVYLLGRCFDYGQLNGTTCTTVIELLQQQEALQER